MGITITPDWKQLAYTAGAYALWKDYPVGTSIRNTDHQYLIWFTEQYPYIADQLAIKARCDDWPVEIEASILMPLWVYGNGAGNGDGFGDGFGFGYCFDQNYSDIYGIDWYQFISSDGVGRGDAFSYDDGSSNDPGYGEDYVDRSSTNNELYGYALAFVESKRSQISLCEESGTHQYEQLPIIFGQ